MAGLQRSEISFRRQGSSGLIWDDKFLAEIQQRGNQEQEVTEDKPSTAVGSVNTIERSRSNGGDAASAPEKCRQRSSRHRRGSLHVVFALLLARRAKTAAGHRSPLSDAFVSGDRRWIFRLPYMAQDGGSLCCW
ncbi:hypothetical protein Acr_19g0009060 [Actinidia rufa]|uniref:MAPK kinase substrate protein n=1 Tax=Actinidia rufa TaxID=165716 RepID=A0A7J0GAZ8_9ERIC|nr:hypothetical protein Acr_19g0009060 [Actinidia rufa]